MIRRQVVLFPLLLSTLLILALFVPEVTYAQGVGDSDGDGVPDAVDQCPTVPGPKENHGCPYDKDGDGVPDNQDACPNEAGSQDNQGCPVAQPQFVPQYSDRDNDGLADNMDLCVDQPGPIDNGGCPLPEPTATPQPPPLPALPETGQCVLATQGYESVNVHALPDTGAEVVAGMDPYATYPAFARLINGDETWYQIEEGWAAGWVVRLGGQCDGLTEITFGPAFDGSFFDVFQGISPLNAPVPHSGGLLPAVQFGNLLPAVSPQFCDGSVRPVFADLGNNSESGSPSCAFSLNGGEINLLFLTQDGFDALPASLGDGNPNGILIGLLQPAAQVALADGSVKLGDVNLDSILIGLSPKPDSAAFGDGSVVPSDTNGILIGLLLPAVQRTLGDGSATSGDTNGILIGLLLPAVQTALGDGSATSGDTNGILIGLLLPAVQTALGDGSATSGDTNGILIGLLLPAVQKATEGGPDSEAFSFDVFVPGGGAFNLNFSLTGDHMEVHAFDLFTPGPGGEIFSLNFPMPGGAA